LFVLKVPLHRSWLIFDKVIVIVYVIGIVTNLSRSDVHVADVWENLFNVSIEEFFSKKITNKLVQQLQVACVPGYVLASFDRICDTS